MQAMAKADGEPEEPIWSDADMGLVSAANGSRQSKVDDDDALGRQARPHNGARKYFCMVRRRLECTTQYKDVWYRRACGGANSLFALLLSIESLLLARGEIPLFP